MFFNMGPQRPNGGVHLALLHLAKKNGMADMDERKSFDTL